MIMCPGCGAEMVQLEDQSQLDCPVCGIYIYDKKRKEFFSEYREDEHSAYLGIGSLYPSDNNNDD